MNRRGCLSRLLVLTGLVLLAAAGTLCWLGRTAPGPAAGTGTPLPGATLTPDPAPRIVLGPTAAAVATWLPRPAALPTAGPSSTRPAAAVRLVIPSLGIDVRIVEVGWRAVQTADGPLGEWETVSGAVGFHRGSADPGEAGNCVLSGHSAEEGGAALRGIERIPIGDSIVLYNAQGFQYNYMVTGVITLDETGATEAERREHARWMDPTPEPVLTVVTCWPEWSYTHRIVVRAELGMGN